MADRTERIILEAVTGAYTAALRLTGVETEVLEAKTASLKTMVGAADGSMRGIVGTLSSLSAGQVGVAATAAAVAAGVVKMGKDGVKAYVELATEVRNYERATGDSARESSIMIERAKALGVSTDSLGLAVFRMAKNVSANRDELRRLGVEVAYNADGSLNLSKTLDALNAAHRRAGSGAEFDRISQLALGRGASQLLPLLTATRERLDEIDAAARQHHTILGQEDLDRVLDYKVATHELGDAWRGVEMELGRGVVPLLTEVSHFLTGIIEDADKLGRIKGPDFGFREARDSQKNAGNRPIDRLAQNDPSRNLPGVQALWHALGATTEAEAKVSAATKERTRAAEQERIETERDAAAVQAYAGTLDDLYAKTFGVTEASDRFESDLAQLVTTVNTAKKNGDGFATSLDDSTTSGLRNREMMRGLVKDIEDAAKRYKELHPEATQDDIGRAVARQVGQLQTVVSQLGLNKAAAAQYLSVLMAIANIDLAPKPKKYKVWGINVGTDPFGGGVGDLNPPTDTTSSDSKAPDPSQYLEALWKARMEGVENRFKEGRASLAEYEHALDEQLAKEIPWTDAWVALQQKKADAVHYWSDAVSTYLKAMAEKQANIEDNMFEVGNLGTDQYVKILQARLAALEMYSDEWVRVYKEIQQLQDNTLDEQLKLIAQYEAGRQFQLGFDQLAQQRALYGSLTPAGGGGTSIYNTSSTTWSPTFSNVGSSPDQWMVTSSQKLRDMVVSSG